MVTKDKLDKDYDIGETLKVELEGVFYLHPSDSFVGSEARLSEKPKSDNPEWLGVSVIYGQYAGWRPNTLKLRLNMLRDEIGKNCLALHKSEIKDISRVLSK